MKTTLRLFLPIVLIAALAGCGNKGPLVHPQAPVEDMPVPAPASTAPAMPTDATQPADATTPPPPPPGGG